MAKLLRTLLLRLNFALCAGIFTGKMIHCRRSTSLGIFQSLAKRVPLLALIDLKVEFLCDIQNLLLCDACFDLLEEFCCKASQLACLALDFQQFGGRN